ncbi:MAG: Glyoxalase/bleomycin resistance protein/dioxygenase [Actinobacteria bacterium]|nr:Glyoxalase/bleomycin resistance protein/dioxygenase [Actinomycetota bacterium]
MTDPLESLPLPPSPVDPDPAFAARLRARMTRALALPKGVTVSNLTLNVQPEPDVAMTREGTPSVVSGGVIPYLIVSDARHALDWYVEAFGARRRGEAIVMPDGRIGHAEIDVAGGVVYLADPSPTSRVAPPEPGEFARVSLTAQVPDLDRFVDRAVAAGADLERAPEETPSGVHGVIVDPFGHRWLLSSPAPAPVPGGREDAGMREGDVAYASLLVPDLGRAKAFFGSVLDWTFGPGSSEQGAQVEGLSMSHGLWGGQERSNLLLCVAVDDVDTAVERVWAAGGRVEEPTDEPYGRLANCVDDQGMAFSLFTPPPGTPSPRGPLNGERHGDLSYLTLEVVDSARTRRFFGEVLGWRFSPGRVEDGWNVEGVVPMSGLHGGHAVDTTLPMYRVDDVAAAVERVRAAGGTATDPVAQPYGRTSECVDDQGTRFYLGQL